MEHFAGLDVSVKDTSVCVVDDAGKIVREVKTQALHNVARQPIAASHCDRRRAAARCVFAFVGMAKNLRIPAALGLYNRPQQKTIGFTRLTPVP